MIDKTKLSGKTRWIKANVPEEVADFYEQRAHQYCASVSSAAGGPLCAMAYGEIKAVFTQESGTDTRPK